MTIICMFVLIFASCIGLFGRISDIAVFCGPEIYLANRWRGDPIFLHAVYLRFYVIAYFISSDIYMKNFMASFGSHLSHIQDVLKGHWHCHDTRRNLKDI